MPFAAKETLPVGVPEPECVTVAVTSVLLLVWIAGGFAPRVVVVP